MFLNPPMTPMMKSRTVKKKDVPIFLSSQLPRKRPPKINRTKAKPMLM